VYNVFDVCVQVIGARHLQKKKQKLVSPFVEIEIVGLDCDNNKFKTVPSCKHMQCQLMVCRGMFKPI